MLLLSLAQILNYTRISQCVCAARCWRDRAAAGPPPAQEPHSAVSRVPRRRDQGADCGLPAPRLGARQLARRPVPEPGLLRFCERRALLSHSRLPQWDTIKANAASAVGQLLANVPVETRREFHLNPMLITRALVQLLGDRSPLVRRHVAGAMALLWTY